MWFNKLKNQELPYIDYIKALNVWHQNKIKILRDYLEWYNNCDVIPFVQAIERMQMFKKKSNLDMFKGWSKCSWFSVKIPHERNKR